MSGARTDGSQSRTSSRKKTKLFRNPLTLLKSKNNVAGRYDYLSDEESVVSFEDLPLGIHGRDGSFNFDFENDSDSDEECHDSLTVGTASKNLSPNSYAQIHFHASFDDEDEVTDMDRALTPRPCASERHLSALQPDPRSVSHRVSRTSYAASYFPCGKAPLSHHEARGRVYEADSDTSGTVDTEDDYDETYTLPKKKTICFADEHGHPLHTVYVTERDIDDDHLFHLRFIVLLLNPKKKQFEFLHLTTPREERTQIAEAIKHLSDMASDPSFTKERYVGLCRPFKDGQELINSLCMQDYDVDRDEILIAIPSGIKGKQIVKVAKPLLSDRNVLKTVRRKMRSGFALQSLHYAVESREVTQDDEHDNDDEDLKTTHEALSNGPNQPDVQQCSIKSAERHGVEDDADEVLTKDSEKATCQVDVRLDDDGEEPQSERLDSSDGQRPSASEGITESGSEEGLPLTDNDELHRYGSMSQGMADCDNDCNEPRLGATVVDTQDAREEAKHETQIGKDSEGLPERNDVDSCASSADSTVCRIKRLLMGISAAPGEGNGRVEIFEAEDADASTARGDGGMEQIAKFIDELQEDVRSEIEAIHSSTDESDADQQVADDMQAPQGNGPNDIVAWFAPLENQLKNALDDFNTSAVEDESLDVILSGGTTGPIEPSAGYAHVDDTPLSISEAMEMVTSFEESFEMSTKDDNRSCPEVEGGNTSAIADDVVSSDATIDGGATSEKLTVEREFAAAGGGEALSLAHGELRTTHDLQSTSVGSDAELIHKMKIEGTGPAANCVPALDKAAAVGEEADDGDQAGCRGTLSASSSDVDEDEDDESGSFPVVRQPTSKVDHDDECEMEDVPILDDDDDEAEDSYNPSVVGCTAMVGTLQKSRVSFVHAHVKYIGSGSFSASRDENDCGPKSSLPLVGGAGSRTTESQQAATVKVELDEVSMSTISDRDEERKRATLLFRILNATVLIAIGFLLRTFGGKKKASAK